MTDTLKPCPFCGGEAFVYPSPPRDPMIMCGGCAGFIEGLTIEAAINRWNTRAPVPVKPLADASLIKLLREAHAAMRATGWHLAPSSAMGSDDGILETAVADIEKRLAEFLAEKDEADD